MLGNFVFACRGRAFPRLAAQVRTRGKRGFTLVEMLCALVVLSLMTGLVAMGVSTGMRVSEKQRFSSQAQMLSASISEALADPFRFMAVKDADAQTYLIAYDGIDITFTGGNDCSLLQVGDDGTLSLRGTAYSSGSAPVKLLNDGAYGDCYIESGLLLNCSAERVYCSYVIRSESNDSLLKQASFEFTPLDGVEKNVGWNSAGNAPATDNAKLARQQLAVALSDARAALSAGDDKEESAKAALRAAIAEAQSAYAERGRDADYYVEACTVLRDAIDAFNEAGSQSQGGISLSLADLQNLVNDVASYLETARKIDPDDLRQDAVHALDAARAVIAQGEPSDLSIKTAFDALNEAYLAYAALQDYHESTVPTAGATVTDAEKQLKATLPNGEQLSVNLEQSNVWQSGQTSDGTLCLLARPEGSWADNIIELVYYNGTYYAPFGASSDNASEASYWYLRWFYTSYDYSISDITSGRIYTTNWNRVRWFAVS